MKCVEEPGIQTFYNNMEILTTEIWWANPTAKSSIDNGKLKHELKSHRWYKTYSPYNFFVENVVSEVSNNTTVK